MHQHWGVFIADDVDRLSSARLGSPSLMALPLCASDCDCPAPNVLPGDIIHVDDGTESGCLCSCGRVIFLSWHKNALVSAVANLQAISCCFCS